MKKNILILAILSLILIVFLGFNAKTASAYDSGCIGSVVYSITTGQLCSAPQYSYSNGYSNTNYSYGCTSAGPFNIITGQLCPGEQYPNNNYSYPYTNPSPYVNPNIYPYYNQTPTISGINGPQALNINQTGTWTVMASSINSGNLTYSVNWGDQPVYAYGVNSNYVYPSQQNATFTHTYTQAGTYTPVFTVTNSSGQSVNSSLSVVVSGYNNTSYIAPVISSISISSGRVGTQFTIYGRGFNNTNICNIYSCANNIYSSNSYNTISFGLSIIPNVISSDGATLTFTIPAYTNSACQYTTPACVIPQYQIIPGTYPIFVTNTNGTSNAVNFTVTY